MKFKLALVSIVIALFSAVTPVSVAPPAPADAHTPNCVAKYPYMQWRDYPIFKYVDPKTGATLAYAVRRYFINVSTGSKHYHMCVRQA